MTFTNLSPVVTEDMLEVVYNNIVECDPVKLTFRGLLHDLLGKIEIVRGHQTRRTGALSRHGFHRVRLEAWSTRFYLWEITWVNLPTSWRGAMSSWNLQLLDLRIMGIESRKAKWSVK